MDMSDVIATTNLLILCGYAVEHFFAGYRKDSLSERKENFITAIKLELNGDPPDYLEKIMDDCADIAAFFEVSLEPAGLSMSKFEEVDPTFSALVLAELVQRAPPTIIPSVMKALRFLNVYFKEKIQLEGISSLLKNLKLYSNHPDHFKGIIHYQKNGQDHIEYLTTNTLDRENQNFIRLIIFIQKNPGDLNQFISVYAPSYTGKTQLACSMDKYTEYPLMREPSTIVPIPNRPICVCLRVACEDALGDKRTGHGTQPINNDIFFDSLHEVVSTDCHLVDLNAKRLGHSDRPISITFSVSNLLKLFALVTPSLTIGFFVEWIKRRISGRETAALLGSDGFAFEGKPRTIGEARNELGIEKNRGKLYVVILDEYSLDQNDKIKNKMLLFLRNILRACELVTVLMGTNATALNMTGKEGMGSAGSGLTPKLWAQVVVNMYTSPSDHSAESLVLNNPKVIEIFAPILRWIASTKCCIRPGFMKLFLDSLLASTDSTTSVDALDSSLSLVHQFITKRKDSYTQFDWLIGQVRALLSGIYQNTTIEGVAVSRKIEARLINRHYAYLDSYSDPEIPLFTLIREVEGQRLLLRPLGWKKVPNSKDISLRHPAVANACKANSVTIENFLEGINVITPCKSNISPNNAAYDPGCGFPSFNADELGFLSLFHTATPFPSKQSLDEVELPDAFKGLFNSIKGPLSHETNGLTTRAALTLAFMFFSGREQSADYTVPGESKVGSFLEIVAHACFVIASYKFGLGGSLFTDYLCQFISEFSMKNISGLKLSESSVRLLGAVASIKMPLFPLIHSTCSAGLRSIPGVHLGSMFMCYNYDQIDGIGFTNRLMNLNAVSDFFLDHFISSEKKSLLLNASILIAVAEKAVMNQRELFNKESKEEGKTSATSIRDQIPQLRKPMNHLHFLIVEDITSLQWRSQIKLYRKFGNINFLLASSINTDNTIELTKLYDAKNKAFKTELKKLLKEEKAKAAEASTEVLIEEAVPLVTSEDVVDNELQAEETEELDVEIEIVPTIVPEIPITFIVIPFKKLFSKDGPMTFSGSQYEASAKRPHSATIDVTDTEIQL